MNVLYLCHRIPYPPDKGDKIRSYHLLTFLARRGAVDLVTHVDDPRDLRHLPLLRDICRSVSVFPLGAWSSRLRAAAALPTGASLSVAYFTRGAASRRVRELLAARSYDLVVGCSSQVAAYLPEDLRVPVVMDLVDVDSEKFLAYGRNGGVRGLLHRIEARRLRRFERGIGERASRVVVTTPREMDLYRRVVGPGDVRAITVGVRVPETVRPFEERDPGLALLVGTMDYTPNADAAVFGAREVWPLVRARNPDARYRIVGRRPPPEVRALGRLPGIEVTGEVPDVGAHYEEAALALVPLRIARGVQNKVLESMAHGLPVVATADVVHTLHPEARHAMSMASDPAGMAEHVLRLMGSLEDRRREGTAAREFVRTHHDWARLEAEWSRLFDEVAQP